MTKNISTSVRVRFAPSPTGGLHIGGLRTAIYNYLFAKKHGGVFILRIEDTDQTRFVASAEEYIKTSLERIGIVPDESPWVDSPYGPYRQSERDYKTFIEELISKGGAYYAFDTAEELTAARGDNQKWSYNPQTRMSMKNSFTMTKEEVQSLIDAGTPYVIRFNTPENKEITFIDKVRGTVVFNSNQTDDKVLMKSDGLPTYHFANVCDDHNMQISHVIRGEEWLPSTPLHIMLYEAFGWKHPEFAHLPLLLNPDGKGKLSKRKANEYGIPVFPMDWKTIVEGIENVSPGFLDRGFEPDALVNFLCLLGWSPGQNKELMSRQELIENFSLEGIQKAGARFDIKKAEWFNQEYIKQLTTKEVFESVGIQGEDLNKYTSEQMDIIADLAKTRSVFRKNLKEVVDIFYSTPDYINIIKNIENVNKKQVKIEDLISVDFKKIFIKFVNDSETLPEWNGKLIKEQITNICTENQVKIGKIMPSLRFALTGGIPGPDLMTTSEILGKEETLTRIKKSLVL